MLRVAAPVELAAGEPDGRFEVIDRPRAGDFPLAQGFVLGDCLMLSAADAAPAPTAPAIGAVPPAGPDPATVGPEMRRPIAQSDGSAAIKREVAPAPKGRYGWRPAPRCSGDDGTMIRFSTFTPRMWLILAHDLLATAAAVVASFFIRFEEAGLAERWRWLVILLPAFVALCRPGLRLLRSLQGEVALHLAARPLQHRSRRDRAGGLAAGARLRPGGAECLRHLLLRQDHDRRSTGCCRSLFLAGPRIAYRYFRYTRTLQHAKARRFDADAGRRPRRRRRGAAARDRKRRGDEDPAGRHPVAVAGRSRPGDPRHLGARRPRRPRARRRRSRASAAPTSRGSC